MARYILKRVLYMVLVMLIVTTLTFFLVHSIPGDPFSAMIQDLPEETRVLYMEKYGFDQPLIVQYVRFMKQLFSGDLGSSLRYPGRTVAEIAASFAPVSAQVGGIALAIGFVVGTILGIIAALNRNRFSDRTIMVLALLGTTIPTFVTASFLQYVFSVVWPIFPTTGWGTAKHMVLPVICLCVGPIATYARYMRSSVLDTTSQDLYPDRGGKGCKDAAHRAAAHLPQLVFALPDRAVHQRGLDLLRLVHRGEHLRPAGPGHLLHQRDQRPRLFDDFGTQHHLHRNLYPVGAGDRHPAGHPGPENSPGREKVRREPDGKRIDLHPKTGRFCD